MHLRVWLKRINDSGFSDDFGIVKCCFPLVSPNIENHIALEYVFHTGSICRLKIIEQPTISRTDIDLCEVYSISGT